MIMWEEGVCSNNSHTHTKRIVNKSNTSFELCSGLKVPVGVHNTKSFQQHIQAIWTRKNNKIHLFELIMIWQTAQLFQQPIEIHSAYNAHSLTNRLITNSAAFIVNHSTRGIFVMRAKQYVWVSEKMNGDTDEYTREYGGKQFWKRATRVSE